jgi:UDPglucose--hexose-1-phosphate uridylyltransferase
MSELRWHPLLEQWVVVTAHRQGRPQMPADWCPFCPGSGNVPEHYDVFLYPNDFPAFSFDDPNAPGACDVVLYSPEHDRLPSQLPVSQWEKVIALWTSRSAELRADPRVTQITIFENTGEAVGVTMPHPHGQIYAFPFVSPRVERETAAAERFSGCLYCHILKEERSGPRVVFEDDHFTSFVPYFARFPFESLIYARRHTATLSDLSGEEAASLARAISRIRKK